MPGNPPKTQSARRFGNFSRKVGGDDDDRDDDAADDDGDDRDDDDGENASRENLTVKLQTPSHNAPYISSEPRETL